METRKISYPPLIIGTSLLLVIFITLCMVIFAVLSLSSAQKDYTQSQQNAARTIAYYEACNKAEEIRANLENDEKTKNIVEYSIPIDDDEILQVVLSRKNSSDQSYRIKSWKIQSTTQWKGSQTLPLLGSD